MNLKGWRDVIRKFAPMAVALIAVTAAVTAVVPISTRGLGAPPAYGQPGDGTSNTILIAENSSGFVPGEELRVSVPDPRGSTCDDRVQPPESELHFILRLFDGDGETLFESAPIVVPEGGFGTAIVDRRDLDADGEEGTARLQVGVRVEMHCPRAGKHSHRPTTATLEVVDTDTGRTRVRAQMAIFVLKTLEGDE